ncbi:hypothetical protein AHiyo8_34310 [Arthrobacter sp. Hiyo8]|nr:hypothetical protein AHiyo8_34310 [Arthrobacter sp. Hiyo8]
MDIFVLLLRNCLSLRNIMRQLVDRGEEAGQLVVVDESRPVQLPDVGP